MPRFFFSHIAILVIAVFALSAVFGLCAMTMDSMGGHNQVFCAQPGMVAFITATLLFVLAMFVPVGPASTRSVAPAVPYQHSRSLWFPLPILQEALARGILQPKLFAY